MNDYGKEACRLSATWLNTIAAGFIITGLVAPTVALGYQVPGYTLSDQGLLLTAALTLVGAIIHCVAHALVWIANR